MSNVNEVITEASMYAYPIMDNVCKKLDIPFPEIKWNKKLTVEMIGGYGIAYKQEVVGGLDEENIIRLNKNKVKEILNYNDIVDRIMFALYHEFKHYVDRVALEITDKQYIANRDKYEELANRYAKTLLQWSDVK